MPGPARAGALIYARDPGLLSHFYRTLLQMEIRSQSDELIVQENADIQLLLHAIPAPYAEQVVITTPPQLREQGAIKLFFTVPSLASPGRKRKRPISVEACCRSSGQAQASWCAMRLTPRATSCSCASSPACRTGADTPRRHEKRGREAPFVICWRARWHLISDSAVPDGGAASADSAPRRWRG